MKKLSGLLLLLIIFLSCKNNVKTSSMDMVADSTNVPAVAAKKVQLDRATYRMEYFNDWIFDTTDKDFNLDHFFTLNSASNSGFVSFFIFNNSINEKVYIDRQLKAQLGTTMKDGKVTYFNTWGAYTGTGAILTGKLQGVWGAKIKVFAHSGDSCSFMTVSEISDSDAQQDSTGFALVESTFMIKQ